MTAVPADHPLLAAAREWHDAGYCVVPSHEDGGKRPFGAWKQYQTERPDWPTVEAWLSSGRYSGIGCIMGAPSGHAEMLEIEGPMDAAVERLGRIVTRAGQYAEVGVPDLLARIARGCVEQSAGGGLHLFIRVTDGPALGNTKLAHIGQGSDRKVIAETRGEGGFVIVAPTPGRKGHPEGAAYLFINGGHPSKTVEVTSEERDLLHLLFSLALDEADEAEVAAMTVVAEQRTAPAAPSGALSAFDDYRQRVTWRDILIPHGWTFSHHADGRDHWTRPGKTVHDGTSATTIEDGPMYVFSTSTVLPEGKGLSKGQVYAALNHGGDVSAAARALVAAGFGDPTPARGLPAWEAQVDPQTGEAEVAPLTDEQADLHDIAVRTKFAELLVMEDARALLAAVKAGQAPPLTGTRLADFLDEPDEEVSYRIDTLWPTDGRILLAAAAKSGKTTLIAANLLPSLVDGRPFLGSLTASPVDGTVVLLNMELGRDRMRRWLRHSGIAGADRVVVENLRGKASAVSISTPQGRRRFAAWLAGHGARCVLLDPLVPVLSALGLDENSNADVATFFSWWGEVMDLAGVRDDLIAHHTGHAGQRSRGASRLLDEPDAIWTLTRESDEQTGEFSHLDPVRYLSAFGRDVEMHPEALAYDRATRGLRLTGDGKAEVKTAKVDSKIRAAMQSGEPMTRTQIKEAAVALGASANPTWDRIQQLVADGTLQQVGKRREYVWPDAVEVD